jgi:Putative RNA methyltransferase
VHLEGKGAPVEAPPGKPRLYTVSIALPGSVVENAQSRELRTLLVGQIARAAAVFQIDEIVVYDDGMTSTKAKGAAESGWNPNDFMARLLQVCNKLVKCHAFHTTCNTCFNITIMRTVIDK